MGMCVFSHHKNENLIPSYTANLVIFACLNFRQFFIFGLFARSRIRELSISMIGSAIINNFREIFKFANLSFSRNLRKLKIHEYYQIYRIRYIAYVNWLYKCSKCRIHPYICTVKISFHVFDIQRLNNSVG